MKEQARGTRISAQEVLAYAAPVAGNWFFYIPMWSILPGIYGKYFGLSLTSIATVVLVIRLWDGVTDATVGYLSDWHRAAGGSRKPWATVGGIGVIVACSFLFAPPQPVTTTYYLLASMGYFLSYTVTEIPHLAWGSEITMDYHRRAQVYGLRNMLQRFGICAFYALPLLPIYPSAEYTPQILRDAVRTGAAILIIGLGWMLVKAPVGTSVRTKADMHLGRFAPSLIRNKPLLLYFAAFACVGLCCGMWFGLVYIYLDSYLSVGTKVAIMFLIANVIAALSTPMWLRLIRRFGKASAWALGVLLFCLQLAGTWFINPGASWWWPFMAIVLANICFCCVDVAAVSILGDIVDYGKWKFRQDRSTTYFAINILIFKIGLGVGGGLSLGIAGLFGFDPATAVHGSTAVFGLKIAFIVLPLCFGLLALLAIAKTPINSRRHHVIQKRLESRLLGLESARPASQRGARELGSEITS